MHSFLNLRNSDGKFADLRLEAKKVLCRNPSRQMTHSYPKWLLNKHAWWIRSNRKFSEKRYKMLIIFRQVLLGAAHKKEDAFMKSRTGLWMWLTLCTSRFEWDSKYVFRLWCKNQLGIRQIVEGEQSSSTKFKNWKECL